MRHLINSLQIISQIVIVLVITVVGTLVLQNLWMVIFYYTGRCMGWQDFPGESCSRLEMFNEGLVWAWFLFPANIRSSPMFAIGSGDDILSTPRFVAYHRIFLSALLVSFLVSLYVRILLVRIGILRITSEGSGGKATGEIGNL